MNTKKLIGTSMIALLVVALSVSMAAADPESMHVEPGDLELTPNQDYTNPGAIYTTYDINITIVGPPVGKGPYVHTIYAVTDGVVGGTGGATTDLMFRFNYGTYSSSWLNSGTTWPWNDTNNQINLLTVDVLDTGSSTDAVYMFTVHDNFTYGGAVDSAKGTVYAHAIPEFATIAIPMIALLGLVLYMRRKKD